MQPSYSLCCEWVFFLFNRHTAANTVISMTVLSTAPMMTPPTHGSRDDMGVALCESVPADVGWQLQDSVPRTVQLWAGAVCVCVCVSTIKILNNIMLHLELWVELPLYQQYMIEQL